VGLHQVELLPSLQDQELPQHDPHGVAGGVEAGVVGEEWGHPFIAHEGAEVVVMVTLGAYRNIGFVKVCQGRLETHIFWEGTATASCTIRSGKAF